MEISITVADQDEGEQIRQGLEIADVRAFVKIMAVLDPLPTDRARARILQFFADHYDEERQRQRDEEARQRIEEPKEP